MKTFLKISFVALLLWFVDQNSLAQSYQNRGYIGYSAGPSVHPGNRSYISAENQREQLVRTGYFINYINFGYLRKDLKQPGITGSLFYGETRVENSDEKDWWIIMGISVGPMLSYQLADKFNLDLKFEIGRARTISVIDESAGGGDFGGGFALDFCTTLRYNVYKRWTLLLETGYFTTQQNFPDKRKVRIQKIYPGFGVVYILRSKIR
jgi:hypothetical protein